MGRKKGTVHPSSPHTPPGAAPCAGSNAFRSPEAVLKVLPMTIMAVVMALPVQDKEVLAYLIARSMSVTASPSSSTRHDQSSPNAAITCKKGKGRETGPVFGCGCFNCYISFWCRWDSSPNREIIHQAIEEFEEHLVASESTGKKASGGGCGKGKKKLFVSDDLVGKVDARVVSPPREVAKIESQGDDVKDLDKGSCGGVGFEGDEVGGRGNGGGDGGCSGGVEGQKNIVKKILPEVVEFFHSRFGRLWS